MSPKRLRCFDVGCNNEHSSRHLLPTSEPLKTQWITFVFEEERGGVNRANQHLKGHALKRCEQSCF